MFGETVGKIISPPKKMHKEYWDNGFALGSEAPDPLLTDGELTSSRKSFINASQDIGTYQSVTQRATNASINDSKSLYTSAYHAKQMTSRTYIDK